MNTEKNIDTFKEEKTEKLVDPIEIDPALLLDSIDEVNTMVDAHVNLLRAMKKLIWKYQKAGIAPDKAAAIAFELHKRASKKASEMVPNGRPEEEKEIDL